MRSLRRYVCARVERPCEDILTICAIKVASHDRSDQFPSTTAYSPMYLRNVIFGYVFIVVFNLYDQQRFHCIMHSGDIYKNGIHAEYRHDRVTLKVTRFVLNIM